MILPAAPDALDEHALLGQQRLGFLRRLADDRAAVPDAERAQLELMPGRAGAADFLLAAVLLLVALAGRLEIDAEQRRAEQREDDRGADGAENVGDGVGHRHRIEQSSWSLRAAGRGG